MRCRRGRRAGGRRSARSRRRRSRSRCESLRREGAGSRWIPGRHGTRPGRGAGRRVPRAMRRSRLEPSAPIEQRPVLRSEIPDDVPHRSPEGVGFDTGSGSDLVVDQVVQTPCDAEAADFHSFAHRFLSCIPLETHGSHQSSSALRHRMIVDSCPERAKGRFEVFWAVLRCFGVFRGIPGRPVARRRRMRDTIQKPDRGTSLTENRMDVRRIGVVGAGTMGGALPRCARRAGSAW